MQRTGSDETVSDRAHTASPALLGSGRMGMSRNISRPGRRRSATWPPQAVSSQSMQALLRVFCLIAVAVLAAACDQASSDVRATPAQASATVTSAGFPNALLPFSDWRASYLSQDGRLHVVTFDAKADLAGPTLPDLTSSSLDFASAGFSPNGHVLAYDAPGLDILNVAAHSSSARKVNLAAMYEMAWSLDSSQLAAGDGVDGLYTVGALGGQQMAIPSVPLTAPWKALGELIGWIDASHIAVRLIRDGPYYTAPDGSSYSTGVGLGALDVASGDLRVITGISFPGLAEASFALSPDGRTALFYNARLRDNPFTPDVELIDTRTGQRQKLSGITQATHAGFTSIAWQPGTATIAVSTGFAVNGDLQSWLLDTQHDAASRLLPGVYAMGWAPDSGPLIVSTGHDDEIGAGPFTISAVAMKTDGSVASVTLTRAAWTFPFIGFVHTA